MSKTYTVYSSHIRMWSGRMDKDSYEAMSPSELRDYVKFWIASDETKIMGINDFEDAYVIAPKNIKIKAHTDKNANVWMSTTVIVKVVRITNSTLREVNVFKLKNPDFNGWIELEPKDVDC